MPTPAATYLLVTYIKKYQNLSFWNVNRTLQSNSMQPLIKIETIMKAEVDSSQQHVATDIDISYILKFLFIQIIYM